MVVAFIVCAFRALAGRMQIHISPGFEGVPFSHITHCILAISMYFHRKEVGAFFPKYQRIMGVWPMHIGVK